jgi:hypothetical protein
LIIVTVKVWPGYQPPQTEQQDGMRQANREIVNHLLCPFMIAPIAIRLTPR